MKIFPISDPTCTYGTLGSEIAEEVPKKTPYKKLSSLNSLEGVYLGGDFLFFHSIVCMWHSENGKVKNKPKKNTFLKN